MPKRKTPLLAYCENGPRGVFKQSIDSTQPELLVGENEELSLPRLNPDSTELLFGKQGQLSQNVQIMRIPLSGGPSRFVLEAPWTSNQQCARLPSSLCIYSRCEFNQGGFFAFDPVTGTSTEITAASSSGCDNWSLSPDGKYLASTKPWPKNMNEIRIFSIAQNSERTIKVPDWAADGKSLRVNVSSRDATGFSEYGTQAILNVSLDGKVTSTLKCDPVWFGWAIPSPDGRRVALGGTTINSNVWMLENF